MTEHSPGPWHEERSADGAYHQGIYDARARCVAVVWRSEQDPLPSEERRANARVIAASTDLLEACKGLLRTPFFKSDLVAKSAYARLKVREANEAIEKATGEKASVP